MPRVRWEAPWRLWETMRVPLQLQWRSLMGRKHLAVLVTRGWPYYRGRLKFHNLKAVITKTLYCSHFRASSRVTGSNFACQAPNMPHVAGVKDTKTAIAGITTLNNWMYVKKGVWCKLYKSFQDFHVLYQPSVIHTTLILKCILLTVYYILLFCVSLWLYFSLWVVSCLTKNLRIMIVN